MCQPVFFHLIHSSFYFLKNSKKCFIVYLFPIYSDPLIDLHKMGRTEKSCPLFLRKQKSLYVCTYRALSICPCHMNYFPTDLWISKS